MLPVGMDSLGVNRLLRATYTDPNTHGLPLLNLELPELLSLSLSLSKYYGKSTLAKRLPLAGKELERL